ncbi:hypothetical protein M408DRAFT_104315 [Serendipita vermifera MAFF 305830]|uniref:Uncharacterized protein n=1 Tax=Serendipita vermifera MAFF 305830 TaxID=933852 RepID=A0A0C2W4H3_SERVB|nr:hypothetical protein M408DRAFT_104315 [Serendipita vermifera MAFF 305830]
MAPSRYHDILRFAYLPMETTCLSLFLNARITRGFFRSSNSKQKGNHISLKHRHSYEETPHDKKAFTDYWLQQNP